MNAECGKIAVTSDPWLRSRAQEILTNGLPELPSLSDQAVESPERPQVEQEEGQDGRHIEEHQE